MAMGWPDEGEDLYKEYYEALNSSDDFRYVRAENIKEEIKKKENPWQGSL